MVRVFVSAQPDDNAVVNQLAEVASARGTPQMQVALAWVLAKPGITAPIVGATKASHLEEAVAAPGVTMTLEEIGRLEEPDRPHPILGYQ